MPLSYTPPVLVQNFYSGHQFSCKGGRAHTALPAQLEGSHAGHQSTLSSESWNGVACACVSGGRRAAERLGMARGYLAMRCEPVLTQDTASSCNNRAISASFKEDPERPSLQFDTKKLQYNKLLFKDKFAFLLIIS